jgi:hypothetical protein
VAAVVAGAAIEAAAATLAVAALVQAADEAILAADFGANRLEA